MRMSLLIKQYKECSRSCQSKGDNMATKEIKLEINLIEQTKIYADGVTDTLDMVYEMAETLSDEDFKKWFRDYKASAESLKKTLDADWEEYLKDKGDE